MKRTGIFPFIEQDSISAKLNCIHQFILYLTVMKAIIKYVLAAILITGVSVYAQDRDYLFNYLTPQDGLLDGSINSIQQDSSGMMWFATFDGLISYDGYRIKSYIPQVGDENSLAARQVTNLFLDSRNNLWIITAYGICRYNRFLDNFERYVIPEYPNARIAPNISFFDLDDILVLCSPTGMYYFPIDNVGLSKEFKSLKYNDRITDHFDGLPVARHLIKNRIALMDYQGDSTVFNFIKLVPKEDDIFYLVSEQITTKGQVTDLIFTPPDDMIAISEQEIRMILTEDFRKQAEKTLLIAEDIGKTTQLSDQSLWISLLSGGAGRYDLRNGNFTKILHDPDKPGSLLGEQVLSIFEGFSGDIWLGHLGDGLSIHKLHKEAFVNIHSDPQDENSLSHSTVLCFEESDDLILVGTDGGGLNIMQQDEQTGHYSVSEVSFPDHFQYPSYVIDSYDIWTIAREGEGEFWLGTNFGLIHMKRKAGEWEFRQYVQAGNTGIIRKILIDEYQNMWLGTYRGLYLWPASKRMEDNFDLFSYNDEIPAQTFNMNIESPDGDVITDILIDAEDRFWIASQNGGLFRLDMPYSGLNLSGKLKPELSFTQYSAARNSPGSLNNNEINSLLEFIDGTIWCCTQGGGINILDPVSEQFSYITSDDGLPGKDVFGILQDGMGQLWASTNRGLCKIDMLNPKEGIESFTPSDGIQGHIFMVNAFFKNSKGTMFFGGRSGLTYFNPGDIKQNIIPPKIRFTDLRIHNEPISVGDTINKKLILPYALNELSSITLSHKEYDLSIGIAAIHFEDLGENRINYMLEGYDKDWIQIKASEKYVNYSNLSHGTYTMRVRGINGDNVQTSEERIMTIVISPPWWKLWYSIIAEIILVVLLLGGLTYLFLHRASLQHKLQLEKLEKQNIEHINESKLRFFTNISHELKTPLSLVIAPLEDLSNENNAFDENYFRKQSSLILRNAKVLKRLIDQIIEFRKANSGKLSLNPEKLDIGLFTREIIQHFEIYKSKKRCRLVHNIAEEALLVYFDVKKMEKVIFNLLSNSFKHVSEDGIIIITVEKARQSTDHSRHAMEGVIISVYNEGKHIPEDQLDLIFERFYQTDSLAEGSGIGLALTKSLVELHQGSINVESTEDDGTTFTVFLPNKRDNDHIDDYEGQNQLSEEPSNLSHALKLASMDEYVINKDLKVLLIEDNSELRDFLKTILERYYDYYEAVDGNAGLKKAEEIIPDLIISDVIMPGKDGIEVCKALKENMRTCHIPVVLLTARSAPDHMVDGYEAGADAYVPKPFEIKVLLTQISRLIKNRALIRDKFREQNFMIDRPANMASRDEIFLKTLNEEIIKNIQNPEFNVTELSRLLDLSPTQIYRKIKALTGSTSVEYIRTIKLSKAAEILKTRKYSVKEVCYLSGFNDPSYFVRCFKNYYHMTPSEFMYVKESGKADADSLESSKVNQNPPDHSDYNS